MIFACNLNVIICSCCVVLTRFLSGNHYIDVYTLFVWELVSIERYANVRWTFSRIRSEGFSWQMM